MEGGSGDGPATLDDFGAMCDELEKELIKDELKSVEIDNEELEIKMGDVGLN